LLSSYLKSNAIGTGREKQRKEEGGKFCLRENI